MENWDPVRCFARWSVADTGPSPQSWYSVPQMELLFAGGCLKIHVSETELTGLLGWEPKANHQRFHSEVVHSVCLINGSYFADLRPFISFLNLIHLWVKYVLIPSCIQWNNLYNGVGFFFFAQQQQHVCRGSCLDMQLVSRILHNPVVCTSLEVS